MRRILLGLAAAALLACGSPDEGVRAAAQGGGEAPADGPREAAAPAPSAAADHADVELAASNGDERRVAARRPGERPLPAFEGRTLAGTRLSISSLIGKRMMLFFFNPEMKELAPVAQAVAEVSRQRARNNFEVVGIGVGSSASEIRAFAKRMQLDFPIIDDSDARITTLLRLPGPMLVLGVDAEGYVSFVHPGFDTHGDDAAERIAAQLRESLRISAPEQAGGALVDHPVAPAFTTTTLGGERFSLSDLEGRPVVLIFFLHTCPHCHKALAFFRDQIAALPAGQRPELVGISLQNRPTSVRMAMADAGLDFFEPLVDPGGEIAAAYGVRGGVPDIALLDAEGRIVHRSTGWREDRDPALMRMYLARIAQQKVPMLLSKKGYSGNDVCAVCHEKEAATWELTSHARAYDTLVIHGEERDVECVSCHVVGYDQLGGWSFERPEVHLEDVGCETCHGRGGPHISPDFLAARGYAGACEGCHDAKHSLGFDFATFLPNVSHAAIAQLSPAEREERFVRGGGQSRALLPTSAAYVGSDACESCHEAEFATWSKSPHAHAVDTLASKQKTGDATCLACHTTAFGLEGGFPKDADVADHADLARVGCESCHGPGGDHVAKDARRLGTIVSLGDKCDSCVILQICGSCHDEVNDPGFEFDVQAHIDRQRHGTIEAGTGKPLGTSALLRGEPSVESLVAEAFDRLDAGG